MQKIHDTFQFEATVQIATIDGVRADFSDGWGLVRPSNTTPSLIFRFEADNLAALNRIQAQFRQQLLAIDKLQIVCVGDGFHNFIDGILIAASFIINKELGMATRI